MWLSLIANVTEIEVEYATFNLSERIQFSSVSLKITVSTNVWCRELSEMSGRLVEESTTWLGTGDIVYQIDVTNECGP